MINSTLEQRNEELEDKLREAISDLEKAQSIAKIGSWVYEIQNNQLRWSKETYKMFEVDIGNDDNLYEKFIQRVHPQDRTALEDIYGSSLKKQTGYYLEHRLLMDDGSIKYVQENCETTFEIDGTPIVSHGTVQDVTEAALIKIELKKKDSHMLQQSRLAQMGEMLSMIAHQWRQPLASISAMGINVRTTLELQQYDLKDDTQRKKFFDLLNFYFDKTDSNIQNMSNIITNFSNFYKPNKEPKEANIDDVILKAYNLIEDRLQSSKIELSLDANYRFMMHENEFMQVILNIVNNAQEQLVLNEIKNPVININSYSNEDTVYVVISDNAGGIAENIIDEVFDPYFSTKHEKNGTGLGLYMSKVIIKDYHGGDIYAQNSDNGAIFTIIIKKP